MACHLFGTKCERESPCPSNGLSHIWGQFNSLGSVMACYQALHEPKVIWFIISYSSLLYLMGYKGCLSFTGKTFNKIILSLMYNSANIKRRQHKKEDEVEKKINSDLDSKTQGQLLTLLRLQHNHMYNLQSRRKEMGELFIERRMAGQISIKDNGRCHACKVWMGRDVIWRHQQSCKANPSV